MSMFSSSNNNKATINQDGNQSKSLIHKVYNAPQSLADALRKEKRHPPCVFKTRPVAAEVSIPKNSTISQNHPNQSPYIYSEPFSENQALPTGDTTSLSGEKTTAYKMNKKPTFYQIHPSEHKFMLDS